MSIYESVLLLSNEVILFSIYHDYMMLEQINDTICAINMYKNRRPKGKRKNQNDLRRYACT